MAFAGAAVRGATGWRAVDITSILAYVDIASADHDGEKAGLWIGSIAIANDGLILRLGRLM